MDIESAPPAAPAQTSPPRPIARAVRWMLTLKPVRAVLLYQDRNGAMLADSITYRALFSVFAGLLLGFSIAGLWLAGNEAAWKAILDSVESVIPGLIGEDAIVKPSVLREPLAFSLTGIVSLLGLVGAALGAIGSLRTAIRIISGTTGDDLLWIWVLLRNLALAIGIGASFLVAAFLTIAGRVGVDWLADVLGLPEDSGLAALGARAISLLVVFAVDTALVAAVFRVLSGVRPSARSLWSGSVVGGIGLLVLQELSSLFVGGAATNPLLASFASLLALLIWLNFSSQVILVACAYIITGEDERRDRVRARYGATTFAERRVLRARSDLATATAELRAAERAVNDSR